MVGSGLRVLSLLKGKRHSLCTEMQAGWRFAGRRVKDGLFSCIVIAQETRDKIITYAVFSR